MLSSPTIVRTGRTDARELLWQQRGLDPTVWAVEETGSGEDAYLLKLGVTIEACRRLRNLNQEQLGELIGRDKNTISRWENGKTSLSAYNLAQLWEALDVPADWLLEPTDSVTELGRRVSQLRRVAEEAARYDVEAEQARSSADEASARPGRPPGGRPPRSRR